MATRAARLPVIYVAGQDGYSPERVLAGLASAGAQALTVLVGSDDSSRRKQLRRTAAALGPVEIVPELDDVPEIANNVGSLWRGVPVMALSDDVLVPALRLGNKLGWCPVDAEAVDAVRHKHRARQLFATAGIPGPRFALIERLDDVAPALAAVGTPGVLKPVYGAGSCWAFRVDRAEELGGLLAQSWQEMSSDSYVNRSQMKADSAFVYESYLVGDGRAPDPRLADYCSVEGIVTAGRVRVLGVSDRFPPAAPFRETGVVFPSERGAAEQDAVVEVARAAVHTLGMQSGAFHIEIKNTPTGPVLIECNPRPGGPIPYLWESLTGANFAQAYLAALYGDDAAFALPFSAACGEHLLYAEGNHAGVLAEITGVEHAVSLPGVESFEQWLHAGDTVNPHEGDYSAVGRAWSRCGSPRAVLDIDARLRDVVHATLKSEADC